jgi:hypothetical protein
VVSNQVEFTLRGEAGVSYVIESSPDAQSWQPVTTNISAEVTRQITVEAPTNDMTFYRAWREPLPMFFGALVVRSNINLNGSNISVDSYDSGDTNHSTTSGHYHPSKRKAGGDVFSASGFIDAGNADIKGKLYTGAINASQYSVGPYGSVGDLIWMGPGIQPGWYHTNFHWALPDVAPPYLTGLPPSAEGTTNFWVLGNAEYKFNGNLNANSSSSISVFGHATVYVTGSFNFPGTIDIAPGASLKLYVGGPTTQLGRIVTGETAFAFQYYGLPANTNVVWSVNDVYAGTLYAPRATVRLGGGGASPLDLQGACVAESIIINGHVNVHFDENLKRRGPKR